MSSKLSEFGLIARYFAPLATSPAALGLVDDACLLSPPPGCELVMTADALVAGVHFLADDPPASIAAKALAVNLSDLAAKGAVPAGYLLALSLPRGTPEPWVEQFAYGLSAMQTEYGVSILGGDTTATPGPLTIAITALGFVPAGTMLRRSGAVAGDGVYVSGTIGDAGAGLALLQGRLQAGEGAAHLIARYRQPTPRLRLGQALRGVASASLDVSDGLIADLGHIADVSGVRLVIEAERIPLSPAFAHHYPGQFGIVSAATAGDDYEIAFTAHSDSAVDSAVGLNGTATNSKCDVSVTKIGRVENGSGVVLCDAQGNIIALDRTGYQHF